jgi:predicted  nucleic acid-binding Zn-ribbon protein
MDNINKPKVDIMDQIASYSQQEIENFYYMLKEEHESQEKLNKVLKEKNIDDNLDSVRNFIARNSSDINYQLDRLKDITNKLKNIVTENNSLKYSYDTVINSNECIEVSEKLKEIKKIKQEINSFLSKAGI